jgi:hypothetical protein
MRGISVPKSFENYSLENFFKLVDRFVKFNSYNISNKEKSKWNREYNCEVPLLFVKMLREKGFKITPMVYGGYPYEILLCELKDQTSIKKVSKISFNYPSHPTRSEYPKVENKKILKIKREKCMAECSHNNNEGKICSFRQKNPIIDNGVIQDCDCWAKRFDGFKHKAEALAVFSDIYD